MPGWKAGSAVAYCEVYFRLPFFNLLPLYTVVSKNVVSVSVFLAVNLIVGRCLLTLSFNVPE